MDSTAARTGDHATILDHAGRDRLLASAARIADFAAARASQVDDDDAFPDREIDFLHRLDLLSAPFPTGWSGSAIGQGDPSLLRDVLSTIGRGSLPVGRLYEGHVNAVALMARYGSRAQLRLLHTEVVAGRMSGVWMAGEPLRLERQADGTLVLRGRKILCSGAGFIRRPLVAADSEQGSVMILPHVETRRADRTDWQAHGMRATATGTVDFDSIVIEPHEIVGKPGDYLRSPHFRGGAWRVLAVQLGGLESILDHYRDQLAVSPHRDHPVQLARFGEAKMACETARLWVCRAAEMAESAALEPACIDAYVDLARNVVEQTAQDVIERARKALGLKTLMRTNPLERLVRDLTTYLRQPALDVSLMSAATFFLGTAGRC